MWHLCHEIHSLQLVYQSSPKYWDEEPAQIQIDRHTTQSQPSQHHIGHNEILLATSVFTTCAVPCCATDWLWPCRRDQWFGTMKNGRHLEWAREVGERVATSWDLSSSYSCYSLIFLPPGTDPLADPWACVDVRLSESGRWLDYTDNCLNQ